MAEDPEERVVDMPPHKPGILTVNQLFHILRCTPPKVGSVIPNSERSIWYRSLANDYAELHRLDGGLLMLIEPYLTGEPGYRDSPDCLANGSGSLLWLDDLQIQWCTCHYDSVNTRFVTREGNENGALVVGYRTPWAPICNGCRGMRSVEVMVIDYLARWFSFPVPKGSHIMDVMEAWAEAEQIQQRDGVVPATPNGPAPEPEGQVEIELSAKSKALSRRVQALLRGDHVVMIDPNMTPTRKQKRQRGDEGREEAEENNKRPRIIMPMVKRHRLPDGPSSSDPFVDGPSADVSVPARNPFAGTGDVEMLDVWVMVPMLLLLLLLPFLKTLLLRSPALPRNLLNYNLPSHNKLSNHSRFNGRPHLTSPSSFSNRKMFNSSHSSSSSNSMVSIPGPSYPKPRLPKCMRSLLLRAESILRSQRTLRCIACAAKTRE